MYDWKHDVAGLFFCVLSPVACLQKICWKILEVFLGTHHTPLSQIWCVVDVLNFLLIFIFSWSMLLYLIINIVDTSVESLPHLKNFKILS